MAKKIGLTSGMANQTEEKLLRDPPVPLSLEERQAFRLAINSTAFKKALANIRWRKPSATPGDLNTALGPQIAINRLHQIQGWEMFETSLAIQALDPVVNPPKSKETWPDESTIPRT